MAGENLQVIQSLYAAVAAGDGGAVIAALDPHIVWNEAENFVYAAGNPYVGPQRVAEGVLGRLGVEWDGFAVVPHQFVSDGDTVVALGRYRGTFKANRVPVDAQFVHVWTVRNGRITAFQQYTDTLQFARATGSGAPA